MPIKKKVTLMYSTFFSIVLLIISAVVIVNAYFYYRRSVHKEMSAVADEVTALISTGEVIDKESLSALKPNSYTQIRVRLQNSDFDVFTGEDPTNFPLYQFGISERRNPLPNGEFPYTPNEKPSNTPGGNITPGSRINPRDNVASGTAFVRRDRRTPNEIQSQSVTDFNRNLGSSQSLKENDFNEARIDNNPYLIYHKGVIYEGQMYNVFVYRLYSHENGVIAAFIALFVVVNIVAIFISVAGAKYISKEMLKPVTAITEAAKNISINDLKQRIEEPNAKDELYTLVVTFNEMIERLDSSFEKQERFVSDASHELRTPIAVIKGYIDLIDRWGKDDKEVLNESISSIKYETEHMSELINQLLFLARAEKGTLTTEFEEVSLNTLAQNVLKEAKIANPEIEISLFERGTALVNGDVHLLQQLMWIFLQNAIKYSGNKPIKIELEVGNISSPYLSVKDYGMGISKEALNHVFDRFFREDESHNKKIEGNGLGLSIAQRIAEKHDAKISVQSEKGAYTVFRVDFNSLRKH